MNFYNLQWLRIFFWLDGLGLLCETINVVLISHTFWTCGIVKSVEVSKQQGHEREESKHDLNIVSSLCFGPCRHKYHVVPAYLKPTSKFAKTIVLIKVTQYREFA